MMPHRFRSARISPSGLPAKWGICRSEKPSDLAGANNSGSTSSEVQTRQSKPESQAPVQNRTEPGRNHSRLRQFPGRGAQAPEGRRKIQAYRAATAFARGAPKQTATSRRVVRWQPSWLRGLEEHCPARGGCFGVGGCNFRMTPGFGLWDWGLETAITPIPRPSAALRPYCKNDARIGYTSAPTR